MSRPDKGARIRVTSGPHTLETGVVEVLLAVQFIVRLDSGTEVFLYYHPMHDGKGQHKPYQTIVKQIKPKVWETTQLGSGCLTCQGRGIIGERREYRHEKATD